MKKIFTIVGSETLSSVPNETCNTLHHCNDFNFSEEEIQSDGKANNLCPNGKIYSHITYIFLIKNKKSSITFLSRF